MDDPVLDSAPDGRAFDAVVFDLDGTLLNTLPDLVELTNATLAECGYPTHTTEEVLGYVGSGVKALIRLAIPPDAGEDAVERVSERWQQLYPEYGYKLTKPYPGIEEALRQLKSRGMKLAVLSNKFDAAARDVVATFFPGVFDSVHGESPDFPRKPDPTGLRRLLRELGTAPECCAFVGDSSNDMRVAHAVGAYSVGVTWGYSAKDVLEDEGAELLIDHAGDLLSLAPRA